MKESSYRVLCFLFFRIVLNNNYPFQLQEALKTVKPFETWFPQPITGLHVSPLDRKAARVVPITFGFVGQRVYRAAFRVLTDFGMSALSKRTRQLRHSLRRDPRSLPFHQQAALVFAAPEATAPPLTELTSAAAWGGFLAPLSPFWCFLEAVFLYPALPANVSEPPYPRDSLQY